MPLSAMAEAAPHLSTSTSSGVGIATVDVVGAESIYETEIVSIGDALNQSSTLDSPAMKTPLNLPRSRICESFVLPVYRVSSVVYLALNADLTSTRCRGSWRI